MVTGCGGTQPQTRTSALSEVVLNRATGEAERFACFRSAFAAQSQLCLKHKLLVDAGGRGSLYQIAKPSSHTRFDADNLAWFR